MSNGRRLAPESYEEGAILNKAPEKGWVNMNTYTDFVQIVMLIIAIGRFVLDVIKANHDIKKK